MSSTWMTVSVNGALIRQRLLELRLSEREAAKTFGLTTTTMRSAVANGVLSSAHSLADVRNLKEGLGLSWGDLFDEPRPEPTASEDVPVLVQVLIGQPKAVPEDRLARAMGWDLDRVRNAVEAADSDLATIGLMVHIASSGLLIRARSDLSSTHERLDLLRDDEVGLNQGVARVLHAAITGQLSLQEDRNDHQVQLGRLHNLGVLEDRRSSGGSRHTVSDDTAFCLDF